MTLIYCGFIFVLSKYFYFLFWPFEHRDCPKVGNLQNLQLLKRIQELGSFYIIYNYEWSSNKTPKTKYKEIDNCFNCTIAL